MDNNSDPSFRGYKNLKGLGGKLVQAIEAGAEKTTEEWADYFHVSSKIIREVCTRLRNKGILIYPIGTKTGNKPQQGILKFLKTKSEHYQETTGRHHKNYLNPQLISLGRQMEEGMARYPKLIPMYQNFARELLVSATLIEGKAKHGN